MALDSDARSTASSAALPEADALEARVLYAFLASAARIARALDVPLRTLLDALEMAYFHEARAAGLKMHAIARLLDISPRKAALLSNRLKRNFLEADAQIALPRRIEFLLWAEPLSRARILQALPGVPATAIDEALATLERESRIQPVRRGRTTCFERVRLDSRLVGPSLDARLDALHNLLANAAATVFARFFRADAKAFARTISFRIRAEDLERLTRLYEHVWDEIRALEAAAKGDPQALSFDLSVLWAPNGYLQRKE